jgi:hypothetical protein
MKLKLSNNSRLSEIKEIFHKKFPFLILEFFNPLANEEEKLAKSNLIVDETKTLGEIAELNKPGYVSINEYQTIAAVEHCFKNCFGIDAQVFRKSGNNWLETTSSDEHTLAELNEKGADAEKPFQPEYIPDDIQEQQ